MILVLEVVVAGSCPCCHSKQGECVCYVYCLQVLVVMVKVTLIREWPVDHQILVLVFNEEVGDRGVDICTVSGVR